MANKLTQVKTGGIADDAITDAKLPASSVGASELQDNAVGLAQMAAGTDGQVITYDASGDPVAVGPGTDGQVLTSTGAGSPPAFEAIPAQAPEGTAILSTGESGGAKYLREDGDGTCSWQTISTPDADKIIEGDTSIEVIDTGSDGNVVIKIDNQAEIKIDNEGRLLLGNGGQFGTTKNGQIQLYGYAGSDSGHPQIDLTAKKDSAQMLTDNVIGAINFWARDDHLVGSEQEIAQIEVEAEGSWGGSSWPTKMLFKVTPPDNSGSPPGNQLQEVLRLQGNNYAQVHFGGDYYYGHGNKMMYHVDDTTSLPNYGRLVFGGDNNSGTTSSEKRVWFESDVGQQGGIKTTHNATSFETSSDYRLKKDQVDITDGIAKVKQLKPYRFKWKNDKDGLFHDGFFAHEVAEVLPTADAISGTKDQIYDILYTSGDPDREKDGKEIGDIKVKDAVDPQSMDYGKITPILTAALKEAIAKIEALETKVAALEAG